MYVTAPVMSTASESSDLPTGDQHSVNELSLMMQTPLEVMAKVETQFGLNAMQSTCFYIIANWFITKVVERTPDQPPLSMVMTGPGGTGKTYVVNAVHELMRCYVFGHQIRLLAPTGSAASLIEGMTIHKGLGIKIKPTRNGKSNRGVGEH